MEISGCTRCRKNTNSFQLRSSQRPQGVFGWWEAAFMILYGMFAFPVVVKIEYMLTVDQEVRSGYNRPRREEGI